MNELESKMLTILQMNLTFDGKVEEITQLFGENSQVDLLRIESKNIGDEGAKVIAKALETNNKFHTVYIVGNNNIGVEGAKAIAKVVEVNETLNTLYFVGNNIGFEGAKAFAKAISINETLSEAFLINCSIDDEGAITLAKGLSVNQYLMSLYLNDNPIGFNGKIALLNALAVMDREVWIRGVDFVEDKNLLKYFNIPRTAQNNLTDAGLIRYLRDARAAAEVVSRCRVLLVGESEAGKTALVRRWRDNIFVEDQNLTDGIEITDISFKNMNFSVFDISGHTNYLSTYRLFASWPSLIVGVFNPLKGNIKTFLQYLTMAIDCCPKSYVIIIYTHSTETEITEDILQKVKSRVPGAKHHGIDSKDGSGIEDLRDIIRNASSGLFMLDHTVRRVPRTYKALASAIESKRAQSIFSMTYEEIIDIAYKQGTLMNAADVRSALTVFEAWGHVYKLSDDEYVIQPQMMADVLACIFTRVTSKRDRIGPVSQGLLCHDTTTLESIWGEKIEVRGSWWTMFTTCGDVQRMEYKYDERYWNGSNYTDIPFLKLLHQLRLAYPLSDVNGRPTNASLIPCLLPDEINDLDEQDSQFPYMLMAVFGIENCHLGTTTIHFHGISDVFIASLHVSLQSYVVYGSAWKYGFEVKKLTDDEDAYSAAVVYIMRNNDANSPYHSSLVILNAGSSLLAQKLIMDQIKCDLDKYHKRSIERSRRDRVPLLDITFKYSDSIYTREELVEGLKKPSKSLDHESGLVVNLKSLMPIFDMISLPPVRIIE